MKHYIAVISDLRIVKLCVTTKITQVKTLNTRKEKYIACKHKPKERVCSCISDEADLEGKALETLGDIF